MADKSERGPAAAGGWVTDRNVGLFTDQYELTMTRVYVDERMDGEAVFSLFVRRLPEHRNYFLACGLEQVLDYFETLRFDAGALDYLAGLGTFPARFLDWLAEYRFSGDVYAMPEGTPVFPDEPILEVVAPIAEAQLAETFVMNQVQLQTVLASKAARMVEAAQGRAVVDFGARRTHGTDAAVKAARAFHIAGLTATSNLEAGRFYGVPVTGTMAHSYIQAHDDEMEAFRAFVRHYPDTILLVDTYDTLDGVRKVVDLARELGDDFKVRGVRLDSGDLGRLAKEARAILDDAGLDDVGVFASGGLDEDEIARMLDDSAPVVGFGIGTKLGVAADAPALDIAYKLSSYAGEGRLKLSKDKPILPGRKQVFRVEEDGEAVRDVIGRAGEDLPGRPLLGKVMENGRRLPGARVALDDIRAHARDAIARLPARVRALPPADPPYEVEVSEALRGYQQEVTRRVAGARQRSEE